MLENTFGMFTASLVLKPGSMEYFNHNKFVYRPENVWDGRPDGQCKRARRGQRPQTNRRLLTPMRWSSVEQWKDSRVGRRGEDYRQKKQQMAPAAYIEEAQRPSLNPGGDESKSHTKRHSPIATKR